MDSIAARLAAVENVAAHHGVEHNDRGNDPIVGANLSGHTHPPIYPIVGATATSSDAQDPAADHIVSLPSGIVSGELIVVLTQWVNAENLTWPSGWTEFMNQNSKLIGAYRFADGTEGSTIAVTPDAGGGSAHNAYRISSAKLASPSVTIATGTSATPDPPSETPAGGLQNYLWIAVAGNDDLNVDITAASSGYNDFITAENEPSHIGSAWRHLASTFENPGTFTQDSSAFWRAATISIAPKAP